MSGGAGRPILPGATVGIFGGGQLGRMIGDGGAGDGVPHPGARSGSGDARRGLWWMGALRPGWDDSRGASNLARGCDVVTLEIEQISERQVWRRRLVFAPVRPGGALLAVIQDRIEQKNWLREAWVPGGGVCRAVRIAG